MERSAGIYKKTGCEGIVLAIETYGVKDYCLEFFLWLWVCVWVNGIEDGEKTYHGVAYDDIRRSLTSLMSSRFFGSVLATDDAIGCVVTGVWTCRGVRTPMLVINWLVGLPQLGWLYPVKSIIGWTCRGVPHPLSSKSIG